MRAAGLDEEFLKTRLTLVKGWFSETLPCHPVDRIALLHIDADLYESYKEALQHLWPRVAVGGIVAFDEYHLPEWPGAKKAVDEFFAVMPESVEMHESTVTQHRYLIKLG